MSSERSRAAPKAAGRSEPKSLFGRAHALAAVDEAIAATRAGRGQLLLVNGEAGIGKTALASQVLGTAPGRGLLVAWAACGPQAGAPAYWPWVQVLRAVAAAHPDLPEPLAALVGAAGRDRPEPEPEPESDPDAARFRLFDALAGYLLRVSERVPLVIVLDDLQWSDEPSLLALRFVAGQLPAARVLLLGTYRDVEASPALRELARGARVIPLAGLDEPAIAELMTRIAGRPPEPAVARQVWLRTAGNPFFAREVTRLLGTAEGVPEGVRDILDQRLSRLSPACADLLGTAAVVGREFPVELLARVGHRPSDEVVDLLEEAAAHRVLLRPPAPPGRYRFVHDLFVETVVGGLRAGNRARRHLAVARTLVELRDAGWSVPDAQLAVHFGAAGPGGAAEAVTYSVRAAAQAAARLAYEDACAHLERAVSVAPDRLALLLDLLLDLGDARYRAGRAEPAREAFHEAATLARDAGNGPALARAALGTHRLGTRSGRHNPQTTALLEEAAKRSDVDGSTRALVLAALARDIHHNLRTDPRPATLAADAVALARAADDPRVLGACLLARHDAAWRPGSAADRLPIATEIAELARRAGDAELYAQAIELRAGALLELGDPTAVSELAAYCRLAEELGYPRARWNALTRRTTLATLSDRLDEAERLVGEALALGLRIGEPDAYGAAGVQSSALGALGRVVPPFDGSFAQGFEVDVYGRVNDPLIVAMSVLGGGDRDRAARLMAGYRVADLPGSHDPEPWIFAAWLFAELGPDESRQQVYERRRPRAGTGAVVGGAAAFQGPVDLYLGLLAAALGRPGVAAGHFRAGLAFAERLGAPAWVRKAGELLGAGNEFRLDGAVWHLRYAGRTASVPDGKGMHDLALLLGAPGRSVPVGELIGQVVPATGADDVLDATARAAYKARLTDLETEIDEADAAGDLGRAERARTEREFLIHELAAATGLGGRARRLGDETEKARKTVTARIRHTIGRIARVHPELGEHLETSIRTGTQCSYQPSGPIGWQP
jgi:predicted ATPase